MKRIRLGLEFKLLFLLILLSSLPLIVDNVVWFTITRNQEINRASAEVSNVSEQAKNEVQSFFAAKIIGLMIHSQTESIRNQNINQATSELADYLRQDQDITDLVLLNSSGKEMAHVSSDKVYTAAELGDDANSPEFKVTTFVGGEQYVSPVVVDSLGNAFVKIAVPIISSRNITSLQHLTTSSFGSPRPNGEISGVLVSSVRINSLWASLNKLRVGNEGYVFVVDDKGNLLNHPKPGQVVSGLSSVDVVQAFLKSLNGDDGTAPVRQSRDELGVPALTTFAHIALTNWGVISEVPLSDVFGSVSRIAVYAVILFVVTLLFTVFLGFEVSHTILLPIRGLSEGSKKFGGGNFSYKIDVRSGDEIEELADSFNSMAVNLREAFVKLNTDKDVIQGEKDKLNYVLSNITNAVLVLDGDGGIVLFNKAAESISGFGVSEVLHRPIGDVLRFYEDGGGELTREMYTSALIGADSEYVFARRKVKLVTRSGKSVFVNFVCIRTRSALSSDFGSIITLDDLTEVLNLEKMKMDFVSMAAHELRTPLTVIKGYLSLFKQENASKFSDDQNLLLDRIEMGARQLTFMVENFLNVSRIERGVLTMNFQLVNWVSSVRQIAKDLKGEADTKHIELVFEDPLESEISVRVDPIRVQEVVINLINNAINYSSDGGKIRVFFERRGNEVVTHVQDNGVGIPADALKNLFTKFYRVSGGLTASSKGTGLGLYISKTIVELHHGKIWVDSVEGKGSTFSFSLPVVLS